MAEPHGDQQRAAFFDVDGTLLPSPSLERRFLYWLLAHRRIGLQHLGRSALSLLMDIPWSMARFKANKAYLRGEPVDRFLALGADFVPAHIVPLLRRSALEAIEQHRRDGDRIVLLTGSLDLLVQPLAQKLGIEEVVAGRLEQADGRFTGRTIPPHPYGEQKGVALLNYAQQVSIDLPRSCLYSDSWSDLSAFRLVGLSTVVNPSLRLERLARRRGWIIADWPDAS